MEDVNTTSTTKQHHQQKQQQQQQNNFGAETQPNNDFQQQFCLRWHNHQTSLLSTLPVLLDQSHLTDVTISAEGKNLQAHRIVLSACSSFFLELFRNLDANNHPVVIIPGASFSTIDALLTFMYSGEVNVYEDQIPTLLSLAETLGIKGLADVHNNESPNWRSQKFEVLVSPNEDIEKNHDISAVSPESRVIPSPTSPLSQTPINLLPLDCTTTLPEVSLQTQFHPLSSPLLSQKLTPNLENIFLKSLQLYPNFLPQPLNFSQISVNKTNEFLAKYQQHLYPNAFSGLLPGLSSTLSATAAMAGVASGVAVTNNSNDKNRTVLSNENNNCSSKRFCSGDRKLPLILQQSQQQQQKDIKRIDKIVEGLRSSNKNMQEINSNQQQKQNSSQIYPKSGTTGYSHMTTRTTFFKEQQQQQQQRHVASIAAAAAAAYMANEEHQKQQQQQQLNEQFSALTPASADNCVDTHSPLESLPSLLMSSVAASVNNTVTMPSIAPITTSKTYASNSKLYATCFICNKQLSNQYNLRVHLETHQNVRYACNVCTHVSRSKDALRKHVSYRHPGAPSPCETEARRKRANKAACLNTIVASAASLQFETTDSITTMTTATTANTTTTHADITATTSADDGLLLNNNNNNELIKRNQSLDKDNHLSMAAQLNNAYMFFPNQLHFAAAVAATQQQQQPQQQQERKFKLETDIYKSNKHKTHTEDFKNVLNEISTLSTEAIVTTKASSETAENTESSMVTNDLHQTKDEMLKKSLSASTPLASPTISP